MVHLVAGPKGSFDLGERSYLREKVVSTYEGLWQGLDPGERGWTELFYLKVNASWLQDQISALSTEGLRQRAPMIRRLFSESCARLTPEHDASTQSHALETLGGLFLGLGCRTFHDFVSEVLELLCGIDEVDRVMQASLTAGELH